MVFRANYHSLRSIIGALTLILLSVFGGLKYEQSSASTTQAIRVSIDVLPGESSKFIDGTARSTVPVAILSTADFDATTVNPVSVTLAGALIMKGKHAQWAKGVLSDVNGDGRTDLIVYVSVYSIRLGAGSSDALLTASTFDGKSVSGSQLISFNPPVVQKQLPPKPSDPASGTFTNPNAIVLPNDPPGSGNASPYPSTIAVAHQGPVTSMTVTVSGLFHTFPDDVDILLVGPTGAACLLMSDCGGENATTANPPVLTFDDSASSSVPDNPPDNPIVTGTYKPTRGTSHSGMCPGDGADNCVPDNFPPNGGPGPQPPPGPYGSTLSVFNGTNPNGTWMLYVIDDSNGDTGEIVNGWSLSITAPLPCPDSILPGHQSFSASAGMGSFSVNADVSCNWTAASNAGWIHVTSGAGSGNGTVNYTVDANTNPTIRNGTITTGFFTFTVFQGIDFADVPTNHPFYNEIGKLSARSVTLGCGGGNYCPNDPVLREQMAAFIMRAKGEFSPQTPQSQRFNDVPPSNQFYAFIDRLAALQITLGCQTSPPLYCPSDPVLRQQMAAFIIRGIGEFNPPTPPSQRFNDVPPSNQFYNFIDRMAVLNITLGCSVTPPLYCPTDQVTRAQMAAFLVRAFSL